MRRRALRLNRSVGSESIVMCIRFITLARDPDTGWNSGILVAGHALRDENDISVEEHRELRLCLNWFNDNLHVPSTYDGPQNRRALSWFKSDAAKPIHYMRCRRRLDMQENWTENEISLTNWRQAVAWEY